MADCEPPPATDQPAQVAVSSGKESIDEEPDRSFESFWVESDRRVWWKGFVWGWVLSAATVIGTAAVITVWRLWHG